MASSSAATTSNPSPDVVVLEAPHSYASVTAVKPILEEFASLVEEVVGIDNNKAKAKVGAKVTRTQQKETKGSVATLMAGFNKEGQSSEKENAKPNKMDMGVGEIKGNTMMNAEYFVAVNKFPNLIDDAFLISGNYTEKVGSETEEEGGLDLSDNTSCTIKVLEIVDDKRDETNFSDPEKDDGHVKDKGFVSDNELVKRMQSKVEGWHGRLLSSGGRPKKKWIVWEKMCKPTSEGGLGIRQLGDIQVTSSQLWRKIQPLIQIVQANTSWVLKEGDIDFWEANWTGEGTMEELTEIEVSQQINFKDIIQSNRTWDWSKLQHNIPESWKHILSQSILPVDELIQKYIALASKCCCCANGNVEGADHLFIHSNIATQMWNYFSKAHRRVFCLYVFYGRYGDLDAGKNGSANSFGKCEAGGVLRDHSGNLCLANYISLGPGSNITGELHEVKVEILLGLNSGVPTAILVPSTYLGKTRWRCLRILAKDKVKETDVGASVSAKQYRQYPTKDWILRSSIRNIYVESNLILRPVIEMETSPDMEALTSSRSAETDSVESTNIESTREDEVVLVQFPDFPSKLVSYPSNSDMFREFCKSKALVGGIWGNIVERAGRQFRDCTVVSGKNISFCCLI
ncbi:hypothetical protein GIB67_031668 [Kingdonia uniflora]|uniref:Uncharacterized protein n=1 Tax=Kingdonia uniflora TaxID=39325 RepID=A0A7J7NJW3_9MAGN|nr:hypothetical protein GIB67_031668 [Kingdonia uniflora]